jgi:hypothetical protein
MSGLTAIIIAAILSPYLLLALDSLRKYLNQRREHRAWTARTGRPWPECLRHAPKETYEYPYGIK